MLQCASHAACLTILLKRFSTVARHPCQANYSEGKCTATAHTACMSICQHLLRPCSGTPKPAFSTTLVCLCRWDQEAMALTTPATPTPPQPPSNPQQTARLLCGQMRRPCLDQGPMPPACKAGRRQRCRSCCSGSRRRRSRVQWTGLLLTRRRQLSHQGGLHCMCVCVLGVEGGQAPMHCSVPARPRVIIHQHAGQAGSSHA